MPGGPGPFLATANLLTSRRQPEVRRVEFVVLDVGSGKRLFTRAPARRPNNRVALTLTGDGKRLLIWQKDPTTTGTVVVWDVDTGKSVTTLTGDVILGVSHDGRRAATFLASGMLKIWDVPTGRVLCERKVEPAWPSLGPAPASLTFSPDGNRFAYALTKIHVVDVASGKDLWTRPVHQIRNAFFFQVATLVFSPDGRRLAVDSIPALNAPRELLIVDAATGVKQVRLEEGDRFAGAVVFSPDGSRIATAGREHVKLWDAVSGEELLTFLTLTKTPAVDHWQFRFSDDGRQLIGLRVAGYPPTATSAVRFTWDAAPLPPVAAAPPRQRDAAPTTAFGHHALGLALLDKRQRSEAVGAFRKAIALDPRFAPAYLQLGRALSAGRDYDEAVAAYRRLLERMPEHATANHDLGWTLMRLGRFDEAIAAYRRTIELDPTHRRAVANLRDAYIGQGNFAEAYKTAQRALQLFNKQEADWASVYVRAELCRRLVALAPRWPALVAGTQAPADNRERLDVARACQYQQRHVLASRLFTEAFAAEPAVADQLPTWDRYNAACCAALAGAGRGVDAGPLDDAGRARLRADALAWLRADLDQWRKRFQAEGALPAIRSALEHWQRDRDLADVRDTDALARLPAGELEAWRALWADVAALLK
jgi:tetratricopeptide (TPR) repeat protein